LKFGYVESPLDYRDYLYRALKSAKALPKKHMPDTHPIRDQGDFGTCVAFSAAAIKDRQERKNHPGMNYQTSPLFIYSECKKRDGIPNIEGTYPRVAMQVLKELGVCREQKFPYGNMGLPVPTAPSVAYEDAKKFVIGAYARIQSIDEIKQALIDEGPVMVGLTVTDSFVHCEKGGYIDMPNGSFWGGHAVVIDGYDDNMIHTYKNGTTRKGFFRMPNSWGKSWGDNGHGWLPYDFINYRSDIGMGFFGEAWSSIDIIMPHKSVEVAELWLNSTRAIIDGEEIQLEQPPVLEQGTGRSLLPVRFLSEVFGYNVDFEVHQKKITITKP